MTPPKTPPEKPLNNSPTKADYLMVLQFYANPTNIERIKGEKARKLLGIPLSNYYPNGELPE